MPVNARRYPESEHAIAAKVRARREQLNLSQAEIAARLGITHQQFQKYEAGRNRFAATTLQRVAIVLDMPIVHFLPRIPRDELRRLLP